MMKRVLTLSRGQMIFLNAMALLVIVLAGLLIAGSIYAFIRSPDAGPLFRLGKQPVRAEQGVGTADEGTRVFAGIGRLRIPLSDSSTLILSIAFPYAADDRAFTEELAAKIGEFRAGAVDFFSSLPPEQLVDLDEEAAKTEILARYNASLRLGKIKVLYFSDMVVMEGNL